jgi:hypothetical protein
VLSTQSAKESKSDEQKFLSLFHLFSMLSMTEWSSLF